MPRIRLIEPYRTNTKKQDKTKQKTKKEKEKKQTNKTNKNQPPTYIYSDRGGTERLYFPPENSL
jgi:hypothetical protein